jgi:oligoendopeptidase F
MPVVFPAAEPPFERFSGSGKKRALTWNELEEQVQQFAQRYRGQVVQLSPPELAVALQELSELTQALALAAHLAEGCESSSLPTAIPAEAEPEMAWTKADPSWRDLERVISLQSQLLFFPLELQSLTAVPLGEPAAETPQEREDRPSDPLAAACAEPELRPFRQFLCRLLQQRGHQQPEPLECLLHQQYPTGRLAWRQLWQVTLNSPAALPEHTLVQLQSLQTHASAEIRWVAYQRLVQHLEAHADLGGFILSTLIRDHLWEAQWRGYDSAAELYLARQGLTQTFLENLLEGIRDRFDLFQHYYRLKSRNNGDVPFASATLHAPWGDPVPPLTSAEATSLIWAALQDFCPECAAQAKPWLLEVGAIGNRGRQAQSRQRAQPFAPAKRSSRPGREKRDPAGASSC